MNLVAKEGIDATGTRTYAMRNSYDSAAEAEVDRQHQKDLLAAINGWDRALRRDECGAWRINGTRGSIHTWGDGSSWVLYVAGRSALHWTWLKKKLSFCRVTQDGDDEGCLRIASLPTPGQAGVIRDALGIRKATHLQTRLVPVMTRAGRVAASLANVL
jgi:hypothetical protein